MICWILLILYQNSLKTSVQLGISYSKIAEYIYTDFMKHYIIVLIICPTFLPPALLRHNWHPILYWVLVLGVQSAELIDVFTVKCSLFSCCLSPPKLIKIFSCDEHFPSYSFSNFQMYHIVLLPLVTVLCVAFPERVYLITGSLCLLASCTHLAPSSGTSLFFVSLSSVFWVFLDFT